MKTSHVTIMSIAAALALVSLAGVASTQAQTSSVPNTSAVSVPSDVDGDCAGKGGRHGKRGMKLDLTDDQRDALQALKMSSKDAVESAVVANNFEAFVDATESMREEVDAYLTAEGVERPERPEHEERTEEEKTERMQKKFDRMVEFYAENGELPARGEGRGNGVKKVMNGLQGMVRGNTQA